MPSNTVCDSCVTLPATWPPRAAGKKYECWRHAKFFSDPGARNIYRDHVKAIILRRNTFTGRLYRDDPNVLAW